MGWEQRVDRLNQLHYHTIKTHAVEMGVPESWEIYLTASWRPWKVIPQTKRDNYEGVPSGGFHTEMCCRVWLPIPQLGSASPPLQPSLTTALLSKCQSEPPGLLCISILALVGLFIPCPRDADSVHSASAATEFRVGWSTRVHLHRPFITRRHPRNRLQLSCRNSWLAMFGHTTNTSATLR